MKVPARKWGLIEDMLLSAALFFKDELVYNCLPLSQCRIENSSVNLVIASDPPATISARAEDIIFIHIHTPAGEMVVINQLK